MIKDLIVVEDRVDMQCMKYLHLMSNHEFTNDILRVYKAPNGIVTQESGVWHFRAAYPFRGMIDIPAACREGKFRRLVAWSLNGYTSVKMALYDARKEFCRLFGGAPQFAFIRKMPNNIEHGHEIGDLMLLEAEWMLERCVAVGGKTPLSPSTAISPQMRMSTEFGEKE